MRPEIASMDRAIRLCLYATLLAVPLFFDTGLHGVFILDKAALLRGLVSAAVALWVVQAVREGRIAWVRTALDGPVLATLGVAAFATALSACPRISLIGSSARQEGLIGLLTDLLLFCLTVRFLRNRTRVVAGLVCVAAALAAGYGVLQWLGKDPLMWSEPIWWRVTSTFGQPNALGGYLAMALPLMLALGMSPSEGKMQNAKCKMQNAKYHESLLCTLHFALCTFCFLLGGVGLLLTESRGGWMGAGAGLGLFLAMAWQKVGVEARRTALCCALLLTVVTGAFCLSPSLSPLRRIASTFQPEAGHGGWLEGTARERVITWRAAWGLFRDHPLTGVGPEMMREFFPRYLRADDPETEADRAHNLFLDEAVAKGLPGLAALVWLLWAIFRAGQQHFTTENTENTEKEGGREGPLLKLGFLAAILAYVVQNLVGFGWHGTRSLFWVCAGMIAVRNPCHSGFRNRVLGGDSIRIPGWGDDPVNRPGRWSAIRNALLATGIILMVANIWLAVAAYRADRAFARGLRLMERGDVEGALLSVRFAREAFPAEVAYLAGLGRLLQQAAEQKRSPERLAEAEKTMARAVAMDPEDGHLSGWLGMIRAARFRETGEAQLGLLAVSDYNRAARLTPQSPGVYINLSNLLVEQGLDLAAIQACEAGVVRNPRSADLQVALGRVHQARGEWVEATTAFQRALKWEPARAEAHQALGRIAFERGDFEGASNAFRTVVALEPGSAARQDDLGTALYRAGRYGEAAGALREALRLMPGDGYARELLEATTAKEAGSLTQHPPEEEAAPLPESEEIDLFNPAHRGYLGAGWSYTETWGTWGMGEASEVRFSLEKVGEGALIVRATAASLPGRAQTLTALMNDQPFARWTFTRPLWTWETFRALVPEKALRRGVNRLTFRYAFSALSTPDDHRQVAVAFERITLNGP